MNIIDFIFLTVIIALYIVIVVAISIKNWERHHSVFHISMILLGAVLAPALLFLVSIALSDSIETLEDNSERLQEVITTIEDKYDVDIDIDQAIPVKAINNQEDLNINVTINNQTYEETYSLVYDHDENGYELVKTYADPADAPDPEELVQ